MRGSRLDFQRLADRVEGLTGAGPTAERPDAIGCGRFWWTTDTGLLWFDVSLGGMSCWLPVSTQADGAVTDADGLAHLTFAVRYGAPPVLSLALEVAYLAGHWHEMAIESWVVDLAGKTTGAVVSVRAFCF